MLCDKCIIAMEKGYFHTYLWKPGEVPTWVKLNKRKKMIGAEEKFCNVWKCPNCNRLEFFCEG